MQSLTYLMIFCVIHVQAENYTDTEIREDELPTKVQQRNLIDTGRELCGLIRDVVSTEARESENAVQKDVEMMISRAREIISLKQENFELKHACARKDIKSRGIIKSIPKLKEEVDAALTECQSSVTDQTSIIANKIVEDASALEQKGQDIMSEFFECSKKGSWTMFACYKKTIGAKIFPLKEFLMDTVRAHSRAHTDFLTARNNAANCLNKQLRDYDNKLESMYNSFK
ncbi:uncharacterized protein LOC123312737 [Coccinella septempunctata]|uniref:uncharacterized protein LOC123312737 n=1 Tax=Coccinella septempunctata TaxID=41139 RepID=UPI001D06CAEA|nr:uncharacterized protein LOC123312737 [Coccinella septempunctata]